MILQDLNTVFYYNVNRKNKMELSGKDFKEDIKKVLQQAIINSLETNETIWYFNNNKKNPEIILKMETLELENRIPKRNNSLVGLDRRAEVTRTKPMNLGINRFYLIWTTEREQTKEMNSLRDLWNNKERANLHIIQVPEGEEKKYLKK